jgi:hypothetical protein
MSGSNVIDAEIDDGQDEESSYATSEVYDQRPFFADAWKGGPQWQTLLPVVKIPPLSMQQMGMFRLKMLT